MSIAIRFAEPADLAICAQIILDGFEHRPELKARLPRIWEELIDCGAMTFALVRDDLTGEPLTFGAAVIVSDDFFEQPEYGRDPYVAVRLLEREKSGKTPWILRPKQIEAINHPKHKVNLCILHYFEYVEDPQQTVEPRARDTSVLTLLETQAGYALKQVMIEFFGEQEIGYAEKMGVAIRTKYDEYFRTHPRPDPPYLPVLASLSGEAEVLANRGTPIAALFSYTPPKIFFSLQQQRVLNLAGAYSYTDERIAKQLGLEKSTIVQHWRGIFAKVDKLQRKKVIPNIISMGTAGQRFDLLRYLEQNPEELKPTARKYFNLKAARQKRPSGRVGN